jgi:hypothetical protein
MNTSKKTLKATFVIAAIALGVAFGGAQQSKAGGYQQYYNLYQYYYGWYASNPTTANYNTYYLGFSLPNYYYWYAGEFSQDQGYQNDLYGRKSDQHLNSGYYSSFTYESYYLNLYKYYGDYYWNNF